MAIRFFHTADLHLESPFKGSYQLPSNLVNELRKSTFQAFAELVQYAIDEKPDFIVIVGDIYDGENRSLTAQFHFQQQLEKLNKAQIPVVISYGNHDHLSGNWTRLTLPTNVFEFTEEVSTNTLNIRGQLVHIHGFSYAQRHVKQSMIASYPQKKDEAIHIGMLHGSVDSDSEHAVYAPFSVAELVEKGYDYWALGHIHKRQILHEEPPIIYPGNIQGRHRKESGDKGFYDVTLSKEHVEYTFEKTTQILYLAYELDCQHIQQASDLLVEIAKTFDMLRNDQGAIILELTLVNLTEDFSTIFLRAETDEWLHTIREQQMDLSPFVWLQSLSANVALGTYESSELTEQIIQKIERFSSDELADIASDLFNQPKYAKHIERLTSEDWQTLQIEATEQLKKFLIQEAKL